MNTKLFTDLEILQVAINGPATACIQSIDFLGHLAQELGAQVYYQDGFSLDPDSFIGRLKKKITCDPFAWATEAENRILLIANNENYDVKEIKGYNTTSSVTIQMSSWHTEPTLFAEAGLAHILGSPDREPIIPAANYATAMISYAGFSALSAVYCKRRRTGKAEQGLVDGLSSLAWVNWKSVISGQMGKDMMRQGTQAEWPSIVCKDGYASFIYHAGSWDNIKKMINDPRLEDSKYDSFEGRSKHRDDYMPIIKSWAKKKTKIELAKLFLEHNVPSAPIYTPSELFQDPLFLHRNTFRNIQRSGKEIQSPIAPHRIVKEEKFVSNTSTFTPNIASDKPLEGIRILDLGIITAGAGSSAILADMGAEVLKIESPTYVDPFRLWAGSKNSPFFKHNNRNKRALGINLKTPEGKQQFLELVRTADVVLENFRRGVLDRMGFSFDVLKAHNPNILLASISGQGLDGPNSKASTFGSTLEANAGFASLSSYEDEVPYVTGRFGNYPDQTVSLYAGAAIALAAQRCKEEHCAMQLDISQRDVALFMIGEVLEQVSLHDKADRQFIKNKIQGYAINQFYKTNDEQWVIITLDHTSLLTKVDPDLSEASLKKWVRERELSSVLAEMRKAGIGASPSLSSIEVYAATMKRAKGAFSKTPSEQFVKAFPYQLNQSPMEVWCDAPKVGEHNEKYNLANVE